MTIKIKVYLKRSIVDLCTNLCGKINTLPDAEMLDNNPDTSGYIFTPT